LSGESTGARVGGEVQHGGVAVVGHLLALPLPNPPVLPLLFCSIADVTLPDPLTG